MIKEFSFRLDELVIDQQIIGSVLGYGTGILPPPFDSYLQEALNDAQNLTDIKAVYKIFDEVDIIENKHKIVVGNIEFNVGKTVFHELRGSDRLAFFVCTAGKTISEKSSELLKGDDPVLGYVFDVLGSTIVEAASERMQQLINQEVENFGVKITNRYSPGYCQWHVSDQHKLFSMFPSKICGVSLTDSALMHPIKSVSGVIGIGKTVKFREHRCDLCPSKDCFYRKTSQGIL